MQSCDWVCLGKTCIDGPSVTLLVAWCIKAKMGRVGTGCHLLHRMLERRVVGSKCPSITAQPLMLLSLVCVHSWFACLAVDASA
jgi:hypothetical protein